MRTKQVKPMKIEKQGLHVAYANQGLVLPDSTRTQAAKIAEREGISLTDFVMLAVVEKVARFEVFRPLANRP